MPTLDGIIQSAPPGVRGFDANTPLSFRAAQHFFAHGYGFCLRYLGRLEMRWGDLTHAEAQDILDAGLALMAVQHVEQDGWVPGPALGSTYGTNAARFARQVGIPPGATIWLDLEMVSPAALASDVIAYCENWYHGVHEEGYVPGIYAGWQPGLDGQQLYDLPFQHYWGAYNVSDKSRPQCGWCLRQAPGSGGTVAGIDPSAYDDDVTMTDTSGRNVRWLIAAHDPPPPG